MECHPAQAIVQAEVCVCTLLGSSTLVTCLKMTRRRAMSPALTIQFLVVCASSDGVATTALKSLVLSTARHLTAFVAMARVSVICSAAITDAIVLSSLELPICGLMDVP